MLTFTFPVSVPLLAASFDSSAVGPFMAATAGGSLAGMLAAATRRQGRTFGIRRCAIGLAIATGAVALSPTRLSATVAVAAMGAAWSLFIAAVLVTLYEHTSPPMIGRVMALFGMVLIGSAPGGSAIAGALAETAGSRAPFVLGAVAAVTAAAVGRRRRTDDQKSASRGVRGKGMTSRTLALPVA